MTSKSFAIGLVASLAVLVAACIMAEAEGTNASNIVTKPFKISGAGVADFLHLGPSDPRGPSPYFADGTATNLGLYHADGKYQLDSAPVPSGDDLIADFSNGETPTVFTAANGDELHCKFDGTLADGNGVTLVGGNGPGPFFGVFVAEFTPVDGSTGRFEKVVGGSFVMTATTEFFDNPVTAADVAFEWEANGFLEWKKGN